MLSLEVLCRLGVVCDVMSQVACGFISTWDLTAPSGLLKSTVEHMEGLF